MIMHFKGKFKGTGSPVNLCKQFALEPILGKSTSNPEEVTCKACAKALGVTPAKVAAPSNASPSGTCGICRNVQKLKNEKLVLHGYSRPGYGWIEGKCFGVGYKAWELSKESGVDYLKRLKQLIGQQKQAVSDAKAATEVKTAIGTSKYQLYSLSADGAELLGPEKLDYSSVRRMRIPTLDRMLNPATDFEAAKKESIRTEEKVLKQMEEAQSEMEQAVANWTAQALPGASLESIEYLDFFRRMAGIR